ncbi:MAG: hypothetical protein DRJ42_01265 [Deltaproteobacteria bacterium]|nr:MAG: hypothetical protein DRJ42_01265 [Deltaproteobacteria bacterium]
MSASTADGAVTVESVITGQQLQVLRILRVLLTWVGVPMMVAICLRAWLIDGPVLLPLVQLVVVAVMSIQLWVGRPERLPLTVATVNVGLGIVCALGLFVYGPNLGLGGLLTGWLLFMVFFWRRLLFPLLALTALVLGMGIAKHYEVIEMSWSMIDGGIVAWIRMTFSLSLVGAALAYTFHHMLTNLVAAVVREVDARREQAAAQQEREASMQALAQAQRLESVGRLAGGVAHDVNNALTVLMCGMNLLGDDSTLEQRRSIIGDMDRACQGALATTRQLLSFSRQGSTPGQPGHPATSLRALGRNLQRLLPDHIRVDLEIDEETPAVVLSGGELEQAILNLCLNARDAMPQGGVLRLRCAGLVTADGGAEVLVEIGDDGDGMSSDIVGKVFEPFFTTKDGAGGTGLGLSMVHGMVRDAGGRIELDSQIGHGTTVRLFLPVARPTEAAAVRDRSRVAHHSRRVLVLEDDAAVRRTLVRVLEKSGFGVTDVGTVAEASATVRNAEFDAFLSDAVLTDGNPSPALCAFREQGGRAIVIYSGHLRDDFVLDGVEAGEYAFLQKPATSALLVSTLDDLMDAAPRLAPVDT